MKTTFEIGDFQVSAVEHEEWTFCVLVFETRGGTVHWVDLARDERFRALGWADVPNFRQPGEQPTYRMSAGSLEDLLARVETIEREKRRPN